MKKMKKVALFLLVATIGVNLAIERAHAVDDSQVSVNVPFDFVMGKSVLKAGSYRVGVTQTGVVDFWSPEARQHHVALMLPASASRHQDVEPHFIFMRYGSEVFLSKVALSVDQNYDAPVSGREKDLLRTMPAGGRDSLVIQSGR